MNTRAAKMDLALIRGWAKKYALICLSLPVFPIVDSSAYLVETNDWLQQDLILRLLLQETVALFELHLHDD